MFSAAAVRRPEGMSAQDIEDLTPSVDRYQPQHVIGPRQHAAHLQLDSPPSEQTGNDENASREDDDVIARMASQVTRDVIDAAVRAYVSGDVSTESDQNRKQYSLSAAPATSGTTPAPTTQASQAVDVNKHFKRFKRFFVFSAFLFKNVH